MPRPNRVASANGLTDVNKPADANGTPPAENAVSEPVDQGRRGLFGALSRGVRQSLPDEAPSINPLRPLGAVEESLFARLCDKCGHCAEQCPQQIIFMTASGPEVDLTLNPCTFCQQCVQSCASQALNTIALEHPKGKQAWDTGWRPSISSSCLAASFGTCQECADACPQAAITVNEYHIPVIAAQCHGCGQCQDACYADALVMQRT